MSKASPHVSAKLRLLRYQIELKNLRVDHIFTKADNNYKKRRRSYRVSSDEGVWGRSYGSGVFETTYKTLREVQNYNAYCMLVHHCHECHNFAPMGIRATVLINSVGSLIFKSCMVRTCMKQQTKHQTPSYILKPH